MVVVRREDMAQLQITIGLDNDAFQPEPGPELARILEYLADTFRDTLVIAPRGPEPMPVRDINGNTVGVVTVAN